MKIDKICMCNKLCVLTTLVVLFMLYCMFYIIMSRTSDQKLWNYVKRFYSVKDFNTSYEGSVYKSEINNLRSVNSIHEDADHTDNKKNISEIDNGLEIHLKETKGQVKAIKIRVACFQSGW